jgi:hypothetical protein
VASYDRTIPPGGESKITLIIDTKGYQGNMQKTAMVYTNDPIQDSVRLTVNASVKVPIALSPRYVIFRGQENIETTTSIEITAGLDTPLELEPAESNLGDKLRYKIEEVESGRRYRVHFTNLPGASGSFSGFLNLRTNYEEMPVVNIRVNASIRGS